MLSANYIIFDLTIMIYLVVILYDVDNMINIKHSASRRRDSDFVRTD